MTLLASVVLAYHAYFIYCIYRYHVLCHNYTKYLFYLSSQDYKSFDLYLESFLVDTLNLN